MRSSLEPPPGLVSDDTTFAAKGAWADANNVRFHRGKPQVIGGWQKAFGTALTGVCRNIRPWTTLAAGVNVAYGTHSTLEAYVAGNLYDITPSGLAAGNVDSAGSAPGYGTGTYGTGTYSTPDSIYYPRTWSLDTFGEYLAAVPRGGTLYIWDTNTSNDATVVNNAPDEITAMLVTPERQVLAFGCNEQGGSTPFNALCIRGCKVEDYTDWTSSATNTAFEDKLEGGGRLVTAALVGNYVCPISDNALYIGEYRGDPLQMYRWEMVEGNCGICGPNAKYVYKGVLYWIGPDLQIRMWSPGGKPQIVPCPIWRDFADNCDISQTAKIVMAGTSQYDEILIFYPDTRDVSGEAGENSRYLRLSLESIGNGQFIWSRGTMERTAFTDAGVQTYPQGVDSSGYVYSHELTKTADGSALEWSIRSAAQYLDEAQRVLQIQGMSPDFENQEGDVSLTVYVRDRPQSDATVKGPFVLSEGRAKRDFRATGRLAEVELSGSTSPTYMRVGKPWFDAVVTGAR